MPTQFVISAGGARIAYDVSGRGPALMLLHGSNQTRGAWHAAGYVERLADSFQVIAVDIRGSGESDFLTRPEDFTVEKFCADALAVADACGAPQFAVCGYSFGGGWAGQLAARLDRVSSVALVGVPLFGPVVDEENERFIASFLEKYGPLARAYAAGELPAAEREAAEQRRIPMWVARFQALRSWPAIEPGDLRCPAMLLVGTGNTQVYRRVMAQPELLQGDRLQVAVVDGLDHEQEFSEVNRVCPVLREFFLEHAVPKSAEA